MHGRASAQILSVVLAGNKKGQGSNLVISWEAVRADRASHSVAGHCAIAVSVALLW